MAVVAITLAAAGVCRAAPGQLRETRVRTEVRDGERVLEIEGYRPLYEAMGFLSKDLRVLLSWEDAPIPEEETEDVAVPSWRAAHPGERGFLVERWSGLSVRYKVGPEGKAHPAVALEAAVAAYNRDHVATVFAVRQTGERAFVVVGRVRGQERAVLDAVVPAPPSGSASDALAEVARECSVASGYAIGLGTVPLNAFGVFTAKQGEQASCREWVERVIAVLVPGQRFRYMFSDDVTDRQFVLNVGPRE